jgi:hypothetical protein
MNFVNLVQIKNEELLILSLIQLTPRVYNYDNMNYIQ